MDTKVEKKRKATTGPQIDTKRTKSSTTSTNTKSSLPSTGTGRIAKPISSKTNKVSPLSSTNIDEQESNSEEESDDDVDGIDNDLLAGFESEEDDIPFTTLPSVSNAGKLVNMKIPTKNMSGFATQTSVPKGRDEDPGAVYLGRIPHGFYEHEMRAYFSQFGTITRLRLSRNKTTGKSKHYAFIEFASSSVAQIVADTMNNYLLFGHILKCKVIPRDQCEEKMWIGANRRWKVVPLTKLRKIRNDSKKSQEVWNKLEEKELKRRKTKESKWKEAGIEYSLEPLKQLESTEAVAAILPKKNKKKANKT